MSDLKNTLQPLNWDSPIVNPDNGRPTTEFMRKWAQQVATNGSIPDLTTAAAVSKFLDLLGFAQGDILYRDATQWKVLAPGTLGYVLKAGGAGANPVWESVSAAIDSIGMVQGDILYRNATVWTVLAPGTDGQALVYDGTAHAPKWSSGGGGVILGSGVPSSLQPAGTLYSRTDAAGVYSSQPTLSAPAVVQFASTSGGPTPIDAPTLGSNPTVGNLLIAFVGIGSDPSAHLSGNWTSFANGGATRFGQGFYRYVQVGDVAHLPAIGSGGGFFWEVTAYEISGVTGTWATDFQQFIAAYDQTPGIITTTTTTTTSVNSLGLLGSGCYNSSTTTDYSAVSAGWTPPDIAAHSVANFGAWMSAHEAFASNGATVGATFTTPTVGSDKVFYIIALFNSKSTAAWTLIGPGTGVYLPLAGGTMSGNIGLPNASAGSPALAFNTNYGFFYDTTNVGVGITVAGSELAYFNAGGLTISTPGATANFLIQGETGSAVASQRFSTNTTGPTFSCLKGGGTIASPVVVLTNYTLGSFSFSGINTTGSSTVTASAQIRVVVIETTPGPTAMATSIRMLACATGSSTLTEVFRVEANTGISMFGANPVVDANRLVITRAFIVSTLPATPTNGSRAMVTDATLGVAAGLGLAPIGGGGNTVPVYYDSSATSWKIG